MATQDSIAEYLVEQVSQAGVVRIRKMFGEYALYCDDKVVALICDNRLFVKPTEAGAAYMGNAEKAQAYAGSSLFFVVEEDRWDDRDWMSELIRITASALPVPKAKKPKKKK